MSRLFTGRRTGGARTQPQDNSRTFIDASARFNGQLKVEGPIYIDGLVEGAIECLSSVTVGPSGRVFAPITAPRVFIAGAVTGNIQAEQSVKVEASGKLWGDVVAGSFVIADGGFFRGQCVLLESDAAEPQQRR